MRRTFTPTILFVLFNLCLKSQLIFTIAGNGTAGYGGDGTPSDSSELNHPIGIAIDKYNNIFIGDYLNRRIRKINSSTNIINTVVGNGSATYSGDGGLATNAGIDRPNNVAVDTAGNIYFGDDDYERVRKVTISGDTIRTIAGTGTGGYNGDNIPAITAEVFGTYGTAVDLAGYVYVADYDNNRIRKITAATGIITTYAGTGVAGYNGDGIAATAAQVRNPYGLAVDTSGNLYFSDRNNNRVRKVDKQGIIHTIAGTGTGSYNGDGIAATSAELNSPTGVAFDSAGNIYIADGSNNRVRKIVITTGLIETIAGTGVAGYNGDSIPATTAELYAPGGVALDAFGNLYVTEYGNPGSPGGNRVRKIVFNDTASVSITSSAISICAGTSVTFTSNVVNGGTNPVYQWKVNGLITGGDSASFTTSSLQNNDTVVCVLTSNQPGVIGSPATSNPVVVSVTALDTASITVIPSASTICPGTTVNFSTTAFNAGNAPVYQWFVNSNVAGGDSATFSSSNLVNGDTVTCILTSNASCITGSPASSNPVVITVTPVDTAAITISPSASSICPGTRVNFSAVASTSGNSNSYQWQVNGGAAGGDSSSFSTSSLQNGDTVVCILSSTASCVTGSPVTSNKVIISVGTGYTAGNIVASRNPVCAGTSVTLNVHGSTGTVQWQSSSNGNNFANISNASDTVYNWTSSVTTYFRIIAGSGNCADTSEPPYQLTVHPLPTPAEPTTRDSIICASDSGLITEPGTYTSYLWNDGEPHSTIYAKSKGGYWVTVTDANGCTAVSPHLNISVYPVSSVSITERGDTLSSLKAASYQWLLNGNPLQGDTSQSFIARQSGIYTVQITDTNGCAVLSSTAPVNISGVNDLLMNAGLKIYPNPFNGSIFIEAADAGLRIDRIEVYDVLGRTVFNNEGGFSLNPLKIDLPALPKGVYVLKISTAQGIYVQPVVRQ